MARQLPFLPRENQVKDMLATAGLEPHKDFGPARAEIVRRAQRFVDTWPKPHSTEYHEVAYTPQRGAKTGYITHASRVALDLLYGLFVASPAGDIREAVAWALNEAPMYAVEEFDLGSSKKTKDGRLRGTISQGAYQRALQYFEAGMELELGELEKRLAAKRDERRKASREDAFRDVTSQSIGSLLTDEQKKALRKGRPGPR